MDQKEFLAEADLAREFDLDADIRTAYAKHQIFRPGSIHRA
jgi:hypothetical protein